MWVSLKGKAGAMTLRVTTLTIKTWHSKLYCNPQHNDTHYLLSLFCHVILMLSVNLQSVAMQSVVAPGVNFIKLWQKVNGKK